MRIFLTLTALVAAIALWWWIFPPHPGWSEDELVSIQNIWLESLPALPDDPTNSVADDADAQILGHRLFFDLRMSATGTTSCATCHQPQRGFSDGLALSVAIGQTKRNAPGIAGLAWSPWLYWDGRKDSLWAQALSPLEDAVEHGGSRLMFAHLIHTDEPYRALYEKVFGPLPALDDRSRFPIAGGPLASDEGRAAWDAMDPDDQREINRLFSNLGKAIAAYERLLVHGSSRFDRYVAELMETGDSEQLAGSELRGLRLFINEANCTQCHNGPLLTNNAFHNTGLLSLPGKLPDIGRSAGLRKVRDDEFNCLGPYSDNPTVCDELVYAGSGKENVGAMKAPSLRNLADTQPYGHAGQFATLGEVLDHYNEAPDAMIGHNEAKPLDLWPWQVVDLEAFLLTLQAPLATDPSWLEPPDQ